MTPRPVDRARRCRSIGAAIAWSWRAWLSAALVLSCSASTVWAQGGSALEAGAVLGWDKISATAGEFTGTLESGDQFGGVLATLGDLDGDGTTDLIVGAAGDDDGGLGRGAVWVLFLDPDGTVGSHQKISALEGGLAPTLLENLDAFGSSVAGGGDLNGDFVPDALVGAPLDDDGGVSTGALYVLHLDTDGTVQSSLKISATSGGFTGGISLGDEFGHGVCLLGDVDGDGVDDLAVGAPGDDDGATDAGAVWILFRNADGTVKSHTKISATTGGLSATLATDEFFGAAVANLGDLDGDQIDELAVGAPYQEAGPFSAGRVFVLFLNADGTVRAETELASGVNGVPDVLNLGDRFGTAVAGIGDYNRDSVPDLAVGADGDDDGGLAFGAVYTLPLNVDGTVIEAEANKISALSGGFSGTLDALDAFGCGLAALGDLDGDLKLDLGVGSWGDDDGGPEMGAVWCLYLDDGGGLSVTGTVPNSGLSSGGTPVVVEGSGFVSTANLEVRFDGVAATDVVWISDTEVSCVTPPGPQGTAVKVSVRQDGFLAGMDDAYTYIGTEILGMSVTAGNLMGGATVLLDVELGTDETDTAVTVAGQPATLLAADATSATIVVPAVDEAQLADVVITNSNGIGVLPAGWTYTPYLEVGVVGSTSAGGQLEFELRDDPVAGPQLAWIWVGHPSIPDLDQTLTGISGVLHEVINVLLFQGAAVDGSTLVLPFPALHPSLSGFPVGIQAVVTGEGDFKGSFTNATSFVLPL